MIGKEIPLKDISIANCGPSDSGVYILHLYGRIMKVGSARIGIQKRMQQYYGRNQWCGLNCYITDENKDYVKVSYQLCPEHACEELESKLFDKYGPIENLPWATRRPHSTSNSYTLYI